MHQSINQHWRSHVASEHRPMSALCFLSPSPQSFRRLVSNSTPTSIPNSVRVCSIHSLPNNGPHWPHCAAWPKCPPAAYPLKRVVASARDSAPPPKASGIGTDPITSDPVVENKSTSNKCVLVVGATGGVGQLVVAAMMDRGFQIRALLRDVEKARCLFGEDSMDRLEVYVGDTRDLTKVDPSVFQGITHAICCTGTTAFPSRRWDGDNTPEKTDWHGVRNLIAALPASLERFVLVSSIGVTKCNQLPWNIMNLFGVLKFKKLAEDYLQQSGIPFTIIRACRLTDGPYTSYDLNTLLKATSGTRRSVKIGQGDRMVGEASRIIVAEACIQTLELDCTCGKIYEISSVEGDGPGKDPSRWELLFKNA